MADVRPVSTFSWQEHLNHNSIMEIKRQDDHYMRIGFITQEFPPEFGGGAGTYAYNLVNELANGGNQVIVFTPLAKGRNNPFTSRENVKVVPIIIPKVPFSMAFYWMKLKETVKKEENERPFDVIHINAPTYWWPGTKIAKAPHILTIHHLSQDYNEDNSGLSKCATSFRGENSFLVKYLEKRCVLLSDQIIAVSDFTKGRLMARYPFLKDKIITIHEAPNTHPSFNSKSIGMWRTKLKITSEKVLLFVGRLNDPRKGLDLLIKALSILPDQRNYVLLIVGKGDPSTINKIAVGLGLEDKIRVLGFVNDDELWELYNLCDLYVIPSRLEGFGLTVLDAAAAGKRIVATSVGAIPEIAGPGTYLVPPNDVVALANAMSEAISGQYITSEAIREHASRFKWSKVACSTEEVYRKVRKNSITQPSHGKEL